MYFVIKNRKKWGLFPQHRGADVAHWGAQGWRGTQDTHGCNAAHKATWQGCTSPREAQVAHRARTCGVGHTSPRGRLGGAMRQGGWQVKGPWVSGPWLEVWGGNANAFSHPTFYTYLLLSFLLCGTMSPRKITFAGRVAASGSSDEIAGRRSRGPESTRSPSQARA